MPDTEIIRGKNVLKLFEKLQKDETVVKLHLIRKDYGSRTVIKGIRTKRGTSYFRIDAPAGFKEAVADLEVWEIGFEFIGKHKVAHIFTTSGGEITEGQIWVKFPEAIERVQRREYFRVDAPLGARLGFFLGSTKHKMIIINVSQRGTLVSFEKGTEGEPVFQTGEYLKRLCLVFPINEEELRITIKKALVKTLKKDPITDRYRYGLEFTGIEANERNALADLIYRLQRLYLRRT